MEVSLRNVFNVREDVLFFVGESDRLYRVHQGELQSKLSTGEWWTVDARLDCFYNEKVRFPDNDYYNGLPPLTHTEEIILKNVEKEFKWLARNDDGALRLYEDEPSYVDGSWYSCMKSKDLPFTHMFEFVVSNPLMINVLFSVNERECIV